MKEILNKIKNSEDSDFVINGFNEIVSVNDFDEEVILFFNAKRAIEDFFEGNKLPVHDPSGDPQLESSIAVSGKEYIESVFDKNYDDALEYIVGIAKN